MGWLECLVLNRAFLHVGELFAFGYNVGKQPHCTYCVINAKGELVSDVPVHLPR
jgi:carotenoid cleavage dioxygenase-like enzyme